MSRQDNFDRFPFALIEDDSDALPEWLGNPDVPELDSDFDGPPTLTPSPMAGRGKG